MEEPRWVIEVNIKIISNDIIIQLSLPHAYFGIHNTIEAYVDLHGIPHTLGPLIFVGSSFTQLGP